MGTRNQVSTKQPKERRRPIRMLFFKKNMIQCHPRKKVLFLSSFFFFFSLIISLSLYNDNSLVAASNIDEGPNNFPLDGDDVPHTVDYDSINEWVYPSENIISLPV
jgi:hypothetical protein